MSGVDFPGEGAHRRRRTEVETNDPALIVPFIRQRARVDSPAQRLMLAVLQQALADLYGPVIGHHCQRVLEWLPSRIARPSTALTAS